MDLVFLTMPYHFLPCLSFVVPPACAHVHLTRPQIPPGSASGLEGHRAQGRALPPMPAPTPTRVDDGRVNRDRNKILTATYVPVATRGMRNGVPSVCLSLSPSSVLTIRHHSTLQCARPHEHAPLPNRHRLGRSRGDDALCWSGDSMIDRKWERAAARWHL
jgi:hypothetical protein